MSRADAKAVRDLVRLAEGQGWRVERTRNSHLQFYPPDRSRPMVATGVQPTRRGLANLKADLKRSGLLVADASGQEPTAKERRLEEQTEDLRRVVLNAIEHLAPTDQDLRIVTEADSAMLTLLSLMVGDDGRINLTCPCGTTMHRLHGYMLHLHGCEHGSGELVDKWEELNKESDDVKRDMQKPPQRERLSCPDCPEWFWISQPHLLAQHMAGEHGKQQCPYCEEWHPLRNGSLTKHINACEKKPADMPSAAVATVLPFDGRSRSPKRRKEATVSSTATPETFPAEAEPDTPGEDRPTAVKEPEPHVEDRPSDVVDPDPTSSGLTPFVWRRVGRRVTATVYHLYKDCGMAATETVGDPHSDEPVEHVDVDDTIIGLLGLRCCRNCDRRSKKITMEQMLTEWFDTMDVKLSSEELAMQFLIDLGEFGYKIVKGKP